MKLSDQVCSLELAKRLRELDVRQTSLFYWSKLSIQTEYKLEMRCHIQTGELILADCTDYISAFTVAELGEHLKWIRLYIFGTPDDLVQLYVNGVDNEANTRAKMLIHILEKISKDLK